MVVSNIILFIPIRENDPIWTSIFQMGWNHQLELNFYIVVSDLTLQSREKTFWKEGRKNSGVQTIHEISFCNESFSNELDYQCLETWETYVSPVGKPISWQNAMTAAEIVLMMGVPCSTTRVISRFEPPHHEGDPYWWGMKSWWW